MDDKRSREMTRREAWELEERMEELLSKASRKRKPYKPKKLAIAVADGVGLIMYVLGMHYPDEEVSTTPN